MGYSVDLRERIAEAVPLLHSQPSLCKTSLAGSAMPIIHLMVSENRCISDNEAV